MFGQPGLLLAHRQHLSWLHRNLGVERLAKSFLVEVRIVADEDDVQIIPDVTGESDEVSVDVTLNNDDRIYR